MLCRWTFLSVRSRNFFLFLSRKGERGYVFAMFLPPLGNSGLHSTRFNYSSFYGGKTNVGVLRAQLWEGWYVAKCKEE